MIQFIFESKGQKVILPINPSELVIRQSGDNETATIIGLGEINILKSPKLKEITIESVLPISPTRPAVITKSNFKKADVYLKFFERLKTNKDIVRVIIPTTGVYMTMSVENFEPKRVAMDSDIHFTLNLKEYKNYKAKVYVINPVAPKKKPVPQPTKKRENTSGKITVGSIVIVNGRLYRDSQHHGAGQTKSNYEGKINLVKNGMYHITSPTGGHLGWVDFKAVRLK